MYLDVGPNYTIWHGIPGVPHAHVWVCVSTSDHYESDSLKSIVFHLQHNATDSVDLRSIHRRKHGSACFPLHILLLPLTFEYVHHSLRRPRLFKPYEPRPLRRLQHHLHNLHLNSHSPLRSIRNHCLPRARMLIVQERRSDSEEDRP